MICSNFSVVIDGLCLPCEEGTSGEVGSAVAVDRLDCSHSCPMAQASQEKRGRSP